jgi:hypothetical protein
MALETEEGLSHLQQIVINGAMRAVAIRAVFYAVRMFENGRACLVSMALPTGVLYCHLSKLAVGC